MANSLINPHVAMGGGKNSDHLFIAISEPLELRRMLCDFPKYAMKWHHPAGPSPSIIPTWRFKTGIVINETILDIHMYLCFYATRTKFQQLPRIFGRESSGTIVDTVKYNWKRKSKMAVLNRKYVYLVLCAR